MKAVENLSIKNGLTVNQGKGMAAGLRSLKGRTFFEAGMKQKHQASQMEMEDFYAVEKSYFDSSKKEERKKSQVLRWISHVKDINGFIEYIRDVRMYDPRKRLFVLIFIDGGGKLTNHLLFICSHDITSK